MAMASVLLGNSMQAELGNMPVDTLMLQHDPVSLKFLLFAFGFPLGLGVSLLGALTGSGTTRGQYDNQRKHLRARLVRYQAISINWPAPMRIRKSRLHGNCVIR